MVRDIFISYSRKDLGAVKAIKEEIEQSLGVECWMDLDDIPADDDDYLDRIVEGIEQCNVFIFMLSKNSQESEHAIGELTAAKKQKRKTDIHVVVLNIDDCEMNKKFTIKFSLQNIIVWSEKPQKENLIKSLRQWMGGTESRTSIPADSSKENLKKKDPVIFRQKLSKDKKRLNVKTAEEQHRLAEEEMKRKVAEGEKLKAEGVSRNAEEEAKRKVEEASMRKKEPELPKRVVELRDARSEFHPQKKSQEHVLYASTGPAVPRNQETIVTKLNTGGIIFWLIIALSILPYSYNILSVMCFMGRECEGDWLHNAVWTLEQQLIDCYPILNYYMDGLELGLYFLSTFTLSFILEFFFCDSRGFKNVVIEIFLRACLLLFLQIIFTFLGWVILIMGESVFELFTHGHRRGFLFILLHLLISLSFFLPIFIIDKEEK